MTLSANKLMISCMILLPLLVLGCTDTSSSSSATGSGTDGVVYSEFSFDAPEIYHKEPVNLFLELQNIGQKRVKGPTEVFIYGQALNGNDMQWDASENDSYYSPKEKTMKVSDDGFHWEIPEDEFLPPQPDMDIPGSVATLEATMEAPELTEGETTSYTFYSRVCYPYETSMHSVVTTVSKNEASIERDNSPSEETNTAGPLQISLAGKSTLETRGSSIPIMFEVQDMGGGFATSMGDECEHSPETSDRHKFDLTVDVDGEEIDCSREGVRMRDGKAQVRCYIRDIDTSNPLSEYHIRATAKYRYYVSTDTSIRVSYIGE